MGRCKVVGWCLCVGVAFLKVNMVSFGGEAITCISLILNCSFLLTHIDVMSIQTTEITFETLSAVFKIVSIETTKITFEMTSTILRIMAYIVASIALEMWVPWWVIFVRILWTTISSNKCGSFWHPSYALSGDSSLLFILR